MSPHRPCLLALAALLAGCAIPPPEPPAPALAQAAREEVGQVALPDAAQAAFCVSQEMPETLVQLVQDSATVRPAGFGPGYALSLAWAGEDLLAWRLLVAAGAPDPDATAMRLRHALAACLGRLRRTA